MGMDGGMRESMDSGMNSSRNGGMEECAEAGIDSSMREGGRNMRRGMNGEGMKDGTTRSMNSGMKRGVTFRPPPRGGETVVWGRRGRARADSISQITTSAD